MAASLHPYLSGSHVSTIDSKLVLSGATEIDFVPWTYSGGTWSLTTSTAGYKLEGIIADSVAISQDDPEESTIDCETSDNPIKSVIKNGKWHIEMTSADIQKTILVNLFGFTDGSANNGIIAAPATAPELIVAIEIKFGDQATIVCPKVQLGSKIDASSLKTETIKGTISGTLMDTSITVGGSSKNTPFFVNVPYGS